MPFSNPAAGAWPSTAAVRAGSAGAREGRDSCCRCQALSLRSQTAAHARWKMSSSATGKTPPTGFPQWTVPRPWCPETPDALPSPILRRLSRPRLAARRLAAGRCGRQPLGAGDAAVAAGEVGPPAGRAARGAGRKRALGFPIRSFRPTRCLLRPFRLPWINLVPNTWSS